MEMLKPLATIFRRFKFDRVIPQESEKREGFVVKITECVKISMREEEAWQFLVLLGKGVKPSGQISLEWGEQRLAWTKLTF
jgi:hypothetical protein